jgi:hypothetical protein
VLTYSASQFVALYFLARAGTGAISANNCATRIGMLGFSLISQPLTLFMQSRLCMSSESERRRMIKRYLLATAVSTLILAGTVYFFRIQTIELVYLRGKFSRAAMYEVAAMLPAWLAYFVVLSLNAIAARYMFTMSTGTAYMRHMLLGYALTGGLRVVTAGRLPAEWVIWCAVIGEGSALLINLKACLGRLPDCIRVIPDPIAQGVSA